MARRPLGRSARVLSTENWKSAGSAVSLATTSNNPLHPLHERTLTGNKYTSGRLLIDAGSTRFPGAAVLAVGGARRGGAGYINYLAREHLPAELVLHAYPDVVPLNLVSDSEEISKCTTVLIGPGSPSTSALPDVARLVVDGGALTLINQPAPSDSLWLLTPHEGEVKKMGFDPSNRERCALTAAQQLNAIVLLKGFQSIVATPDGIFHIDDIGGPELSTAGTGDVLAGFLASMLASHQPTSYRAAAPIVTHALTIFVTAAKASLAKRAPLVATDLLEEIPLQLAKF